MTIPLRNSLLAAALLAAAPCALAEDYNITVPLQFASLPANVSALQLACLVYANEPRLGGRNIGIGRKRVEISGGALRANATVNFNANAGQDPSTGTHYECVGSFTGDESGATVHYYSGSGISATFPIAAGAPFRLKTGVLPIPR